MFGWHLSLAARLAACECIASSGEVSERLRAGGRGRAGHQVSAPGIQCCAKVATITCGSAIFVWGSVANLEPGLVRGEGRRWPGCRQVRHVLH
jgi:hypothetical protein